MISGYALVYPDIWKVAVILVRLPALLLTRVEGIVGHDTDGKLFMHNGEIEILAVQPTAPYMVQGIRRMGYA